MEKELELRTPENYNHMCHVLSISGDTSDTTTSGINRQSELNQLKYYHVCLPPDIMHDLLEGYLSYLIKLMLSRYITDPNIEVTLYTINTAIENFDYGKNSFKPPNLSDSALSDARHSL